MNKRNPLFVVCLVLSLFFIVATYVATEVSLVYSFLSSTFLGGEERYLESGNPDDYQYYTADYNSKAEVLDAANALNAVIAEEGITLLKNNDSVLPLAEKSKITVFGKNSTDIVKGGSGSNAGSSAASQTVDFCTSLEQSGGFEVNPVMESFYKDDSKSGSGRPSTPNMGDILTGYAVGETPISMYTAEVRASYADYSDAAIVVISRIGGEGYDLPRTMFWDGLSFTNWNGTKLVEGARNKDDHYLQLDQNETDMIMEACANFDNVIIVINSSSAMELGFLDDPTHYAYHSNIKAALWIGHPGLSGADALGKILSGEVNPSGRLVDTYARDFKNDPTWYNFGNNLVEDGNRYVTMNADGTFKTRKGWFVEYREGIYTGYRYYETRAAEAGGDWYEENVVYPMGYGLSYTEFAYSVDESTNGVTLSADGKLLFTVTVTNVGSTYSGKDVVQLYYTAPYTVGGIEKAHVVLGAFAKTEELAPGESCTVTLEMDVRDMASYDYNDANNNGFKGYEIEGGEYKFYIGKNAHIWAASDVINYVYNVPAEGFKYTVDDATGHEIENLFDDVSGHINEYLSRANNFANFDCLKGASEEQYRVASDEIISALTYKLNDKSTDPWYTTIMPTQASSPMSYKDTEVKLWELIGKDYDDPLWDQLLDQITVDEMVEMLARGNFRTLQIEGIDKPLTIDADGPMGFSLFMGDMAVYDTCYYATECVLAATWNIELAEAMGVMIGNEGLIGNERGDGTPYSGWYAPAMNLHRSQFGGRNFEYYSEDGYLSGMMASAVVKGAKSKGVYTYAKHLVLNEQETNRGGTGLVTWTNEQAMRELYFKPFEMCVKDGGTTAMMSSFNRIGLTWTGGSYALLTELLRDEWGFRGMVITDFVTTEPYMNEDQMVRAGGDLSLCAYGPVSDTTSATGVSAIRRATKNVLYTVANSNAMNGMGAGVIWSYRDPWWQTTLYAICIVMPIITLITFIAGKKKS